MTDFVTYMHEWHLPVVLLRLALALVCGGLVGISRSLKRRGAGFKTHSLVCIGSALVMLTGQYIFYQYGDAADMSRLPAQVISGIGFLGAGTILVTGQSHIKGLTTAAGLWVCAGIGIALGIGFYSGAVFVTLMLLIIYRFLENVDQVAYRKSRFIDIYVEFESRRVIAGFISELKTNHYVISQMELSKSKKNKDDTVSATLMLETPEAMPHKEVISRLRSIEGVDYIEEI